MRLHRLELYTADIAAMQVFYTAQLELPVVEIAGGFSIHCGSTELVFRPATKSKPTYHFAFTIPFNQVGEALAWAKERVQIIALEKGKEVVDFRNWDAEAFYFNDPAGNIVEFIGRRPVGAPASKPFSGNSLLSVSEIGVVTDDVGLTCRQLEALWQVPLFAKQPPTPNFAAAGNDEGLFIVVKEGRNWYPTDMPAFRVPMTIHFYTEDGVLRLLELSN